MPVERQRRHGDQETIARLQAELAAAQAEASILRARVGDLTRMVMAEAEPAVQQAIRQAEPGRHRRPPGTRWLRAVPAVAILATRPARHKLLAGLAASAALVVVASPSMHLAPWISGTPGRPPPSAAARAYTPPPAGGGGVVPVPPPGSSADPPGSSPPPSPAPGSPAATPTGTPTPGPAPTDTPGTDTPSPDPAATAATTPDPDPSATATDTAAACPAPGKHHGT